MNIALNYDGAYTADIEFWKDFIFGCRNNGHKVTIVTMRYPSEPITMMQGVPIVYTSRKAKKIYCEEQGYTFNIWIDDNPEWLFNDAI